MEADWCVGELYSYLDSLGLLDNTLIIFSSDNGPVLDDGYGTARWNWPGTISLLADSGRKYSLFDGGTHIRCSSTGKDILKIPYPTHCSTSWTFWLP